MTKLIFLKKLLNMRYITIILGLFSLLTFFLIGTEIDENGFVREPFILIPIGISLISIGTLGICYKLCSTIFLKIFRCKK